MPNKAQWGTKHFALKGIFKCASCGSDITVEEKFKALRDGSFNKHVYYHCTRHINYNCSERYINEEDITAGLIDYIANNSQTIKVTEEIDRKAIRHANIVKVTMGKYGLDNKEVDPLTDYSGYILNHSTYLDKSHLLEGIRTMFAIRDRRIIALEK